MNMFVIFFLFANIAFLQTSVDGGSVGNAIQNAWNSIKNAINSIVNFFKKLIEDIKKKLEKARKDLEDALRKCNIRDII
jgi:hypothetical protein